MACPRADINSSQSKPWEDETSICLNRTFTATMHKWSKSTIMPFFFFFLIIFSGFMMEWLCDSSTTKTKAFLSVLSERINSKIWYHGTNVKLKSGIYTLRIQAWDTFHTVIYHACKIRANHFRIVYAADQSLLLKNIISNKLHKKKVMEEHWLMC